MIELEIESGSSSKPRCDKDPRSGSGSRGRDWDRVVVATTMIGAFFTGASAGGVGSGTVFASCELASAIRPLRR